ncbi:von Willebrand factor type A domain protein, partial [Vibrio parahaemolyticus AQ3810]
KPKACECT